MAKHSRDRMVVLAAPVAPASTRCRRAWARTGAALGSRRGRVASAAATAICLTAAIGAGAAIGHSSGAPAQNVALVDATPTATTAVPRAWSTAAASQTPVASAASATTVPIALPAPASALAAGGIPVVALQAYQGAAAALSTSNPACGITWPLVAAIGRIESNHGRSSGRLLVDGTSSPPVMGILLTGGNGFAGIKDTDGGVLDGSAVYDRAIGPMQFIPSTWKMYASDGNGDGRSDPFNIYDAALAAAKYLCRAGGDLRTGAGLQRAVYSYNHDTAYVNRVLSLADEYAVAFNENRLPITAVTDAPTPSDADLPPANLGGGVEPPAATGAPSGSTSPTDDANPPDSVTPTASGSTSPTGITSGGSTSASSGPTGTGTSSTGTSPSESGTESASASASTSASPSGSASGSASVEPITPEPSALASPSPSQPPG